MCEVSDEIYEMGMDDGMAKGMAKGLEKGREEEKREVIVELYRQGVDENVIARSVRVSVEQVQEWLAMA